MARLDPLFTIMRQQGSSDLHLAAGAPPRVRSRGELEPLPQAPMTAEELDAALEELLTPAQVDELAKFHDVEFTYGLPGVARFRGSAYLTVTGPAAVFRLVPENAVPFETLGLPAAFGGLLERRAGLVLVAAPMGSGRTTLQASIVDRMNASSTRHVVSLEDPVEISHRAKKGLVVQREVGRDVASFADGVRAAMRADAEIIAIGDLPDAESAMLALRAAEGGRLVVAFPAVPGVTRTLGRLVESCPAEQQNEARAMLADNLLGVISQVLLRRKDGLARVAAHELLLMNSDLNSAIRDGSLEQVADILDAAKSQGMQSLDDSLQSLVDAGVITTLEAHRKASDKTRFPA